MKIKDPSVEFKSTALLSLYFFIVLLYIISTPTTVAVSVIISAALHEISHILCAKLLKRRVSLLCFSPVGYTPSVGAGDICSSLLIYACGPASNLAICIFLTALSRLTALGMNVEFFCANAALGIFNLIPVPYSDGDGMMRCALSALCSDKVKNSICSTLNIVFSFALFAIFSYRFFVSGSAFYSFFCSFVFLLTALSRIFGE